MKRFLCWLIGHDLPEVATYFPLRANHDSVLFYHRYSGDGLPKLTCKRCGS